MPILLIADKSVTFSTFGISQSGCYSYYLVCNWASRILTIRYDTIRYNTIRYDTIRYDTIRYDTIQYDTLVSIEEFVLDSNAAHINASMLQLSKLF